VDPLPDRICHNRDSEPVCPAYKNHYTGFPGQPAGRYRCDSKRFSALLNKSNAQVMKKENACEQYLQAFVIEISLMERFFKEQVAD
jgi:hypothetical protein